MDATGGSKRFSRRTRMLPWLWVALAAVTLVTLAGASPAAAGTYRVVACDSANGGANNAWRPHDDRGMLAYSDCPSRGQATRGLVVRNRVGGTEVPRGSSARMTFTAPSGAAVQGIEFDWDGISVARQWASGLVDADGELVAGCSPRATGSRSDCVLGEPKGADRFYRALGTDRAIHFVARCGARGGCATTSTRRSADRARGRLAVHRAAVVVRDGSAPNLTGAGGELLGGEWSRGTQQAAVHARDNVGVRLSALAIDGVTRGRTRRPCDFTRPAPCPRAPVLAHTLRTGLLRDGRHMLSITAVDAAGNSRAFRRVIYVDNRAPTRPRNVRVLGPRGVRSHNSFDLAWSPPPRQVAPIARVRYRLCRASGSGRCVEGSRAGGATGIENLSVPDRGVWRFRAWLEDAAGNTRRAHASEPVTLRFDDREPARLRTLVESGAGPVPEATVGFGKRPVIRGTLTAAGNGVPGAPVVVRSRTRGSERTACVATVRTEARGRFSYRIESGPSRAFTFEYAGGERHRPASDGVSIAVRAKSSLSVNRTRVPNGGSVRFEGRVLGRPVPREGKLLQLEAHYRGKWRTFAVLRSDRDGRWHRRYRFEATSGTVTYPFRVRIPWERSYPYAVGRSKVVEVVVRG